MYAFLRSRLTASLLASVLVFLVVITLRATGNLEYIELAAYDWQIRMRPLTPSAASRILIVKITENDIKKLGQWPLSDAVLAQTLEKLARYSPRAIAVDIYRDVPVPPGHEALEKVLKTYPQIIGAMKFPHDNSPGVAPPEILKGTERVGFTDVLVDPGGIVRRALLFLDDGQTVSYSIALRAALLYLAAEGVAVQGDPDNPDHIRFGSVTVRPFEPNDGSYVRADASGYQFLLDYREGRDVFPSLTLTQLLDGIFDPTALKDKVVLIGVEAESVKDFFYTPHSRAIDATLPMAGIALHGHIVSQLLRAGIDGDAPVAVIGDSQELLWVLLWTLAGGLLALVIRSAWHFALVVTAGLVALVVVVGAFFTLGWWIPLVPSALGWAGSAGVVMAYVSSQEKRERANLMNLFSSYTSEQLANAIWQERDKFLSGGRPRPQRLTATALFTDVVSFATISEKLDPSTLMDWVNEYMEVMSPLSVSVAE